MNSKRGVFEAAGINRHPAWQWQTPSCYRQRYWMDQVILYQSSSTKIEGYTMNDTEVLREIEALVEEEHELYARGETEHVLTEDEQARLEALQVQLNQFWDLLRRRRATRDYGGDPDQETLRDAETVKNYWS